MKARSNPANGISTRKGSAGASWARARTKRGKNATGSSANGHAERTKAIENLLQAEQWSKARGLLLRELERQPDDHWLLTMLDLTHYEQKNYEAALQYSLKALALKPDCPLVLFHYAGTLAMLGRVEEAIGVYQQILGRGVEQTAYGECGEGMAWALQLLNDCHYRMGRCYQSLGDRKEAQLALLKYLHNLSHGVGTIYGKERAEAALAEVSRGEEHGLQV